MESSEILEKDYQTVYKPLIKFLYTHPEISFSFNCTGNQIKFYKKRKNEILTILKQLIEKQQIEVLGGAYYDAILPLLYPADRNGQIDLLSTELRQNLGKRPRGIALYQDSWDSSLVNSIQSSGIEYIVLDGSIIKPEDKKFLPLVMTEMGKSIEIFPYHDEFNPEPDISPRDFALDIIKAIEKIEKKDKYVQLQPDRVVTICLDHKSMARLIEAKWFESFAKYLKANPDSRIKTTTPSLFKKTNIVKIPSYVVCGINKKVAEWSSEYYVHNDSKMKSPANIFDYLKTYSNSHALYNRMIYMSMLVNQLKADKMRKKAAREKLWEAQTGSGILYADNGTLSCVLCRQKSYKDLMEVEKILREEGNFKEAITNFDYDGDGLNEYVCRMQNYFAYISLISGAIYELDLFKNAGNYADNLSRIEDFDEVTDSYKRGLFVDFLFSSDQYDKYILNEPAGNGVFSRIHYSQLKFAPNRHEIQLEARAVFKPTKQNIYLKKRYIINSDGMNVQYILRNESPYPLKAKFAVESNFSGITFNKDAIEYMNVEVIDKGERIIIPAETSTRKLNKQNKLKTVDVVRLTDNENGNSFAFEANEKCSYFYSPIIFRRPDMNTFEEVLTGMTSVSTLIWDVDIESGKETEKNINFTISSVKKAKK
jgi:hypothetical protein